MSPARKSKRTRKTTTRARSRTTRAPAGGLGVNEPGSDRKAALGTKHTCFGCGAKFYDLNRPEPVCPKCGEDQRKRPKQAQTGQPAPAPPAPKRPAGPRLPRLADEEEEAEDEATYGGEEDADMDLGLGGLDEAEELEDEEEDLEEPGAGDEPEEP